jgi:5'-nucleotidase
MPPRQAGQLKIFFSIRSLLDLEEADDIFKTKGSEAYADYLTARGEHKKRFSEKFQGRKLKKGPAWDFAKAAARINKKLGQPVIDVGVYCKDTMETALPLFLNLDHQGLVANYRRFTAGKKLTNRDHAAFGTDLLLTRNPKDAQNAVDRDIAAAVVNFPPGIRYKAGGSTLRIFVDGDAVAFGSSAERDFKEGGHDVPAFHAREFSKVSTPVEKGPFTDLLVKMSQINRQFAAGKQPFEITLLTSRGAKASARAIFTLQSLGVELNGGAIFLDGVPKLNSLKSHRPHIFLDDQQTHLRESQDYCLTGHVPYVTGGAMDLYLKKEKETKKRTPRRRVSR